MSWIDNIENVKFTIRTGDGKEYYPLWKNGSKTKEYNVSSYNFIDVDGSFTDRKKPQSPKFPLVFWFQGDNNLELAQAFETSADDPRPWLVKHPFYGNINGQPLSIKRDDSNYNVTEITVDFWESINQDYPNPEKSVEDVVRSKVSEVSLITAQSYAFRIKPTSNDQQVVQNNITQLSSSFNKLFDADNFSEYQQLISKSLNNSSKLVSDPYSSILSAQDLLLVPSLFSQSVIDRFKGFVNAFGTLKQTLSESNTVGTKLFFESQSATCLASMCQAASIPVENDYVTRSQIEEIVSILVEIYDEYLTLLDSSQVSITDVLNSYHPSAETQFNLYELIVETTGNLFKLAFNSKQERIVETQSSTNLILLTHRYLGLDANDENIEEFRQLNNIKNDELFRIRKGREIKYLV